MLLTALIVTLIGASWVFMLGVMVGRGYNPEAKVSELTGRILRSKQAPPVQEPPPAILRPEELTFSAALRDKPVHTRDSALEAPAAQTPAHQAQVNESAAIVAAKNAPATQSAQLPAQIAPQAAQPVRFDFVYQVAAFRDAGQADRLRERLEGEGVRTTMETSPAKGGKSLYKVVAVRRGTEEDDKQLLALLERLRLGPPLLRSKKPVPPPPMDVPAVPQGQPLPRAKKTPPAGTKTR